MVVRELSTSGVTALRKARVQLDGMPIRGIVGEDIVGRVAGSPAVDRGVPPSSLCVVDAHFFDGETESIRLEVVRGPVWSAVNPRDVL